MGILDPMPADATVRIKRKEAAWRDKRRAYKVLIDGAEIGRIRDGETRDFPVSPGQHTVRVKIDWTGSEELTFFARQREVGVFSTHPFTGLAILALLRSIFQHDRYVVLTEESGL
jgi:hypothetical protein